MSTLAETQSKYFVTLDDIMPSRMRKPSNTLLNQIENKVSIEFIPKSYLSSTGRFKLANFSAQPKVPYVKKDRDFVLPPRVEIGDIKIDNPIIERGMSTTIGVSRGIDSKSTLIEVGNENTNMLDTVYAHRYNNAKLKIRKTLIDNMYSENVILHKLLTPTGYIQSDGNTFSIHVKPEEIANKFAYDRYKHFYNIYVKEIGTIPAAHQLIKFIHDKIQNSPIQDILKQRYDANLNKFISNEANDVIFGATKYIESQMSSDNYLLLSAILYGKLPSIMQQQFKSPNYVVQPSGKIITIRVVVKNYKLMVDNVYSTIKNFGHSKGEVVLPENEQKTALCRTFHYTVYKKIDKAYLNILKANLGVLMAGHADGRYEYTYDTEGYNDNVDHGRLRILEVNNNLDYTSALMTSIDLHGDLISADGKGSHTNDLWESTDNNGQIINQFDFYFNGIKSYEKVTTVTDPKPEEPSFKPDDIFVADVNFMVNCKYVCNNAVELGKNLENNQGRFKILNETCFTKVFNFMKPISRSFHNKIKNNADYYYLSILRGNIEWSNKKWMWLDSACAFVEEAAEPGYYLNPSRDTTSAKEKMFQSLCMVNLTSIINVAVYHGMPVKILNPYDKTLYMHLKADVDGKIMYDGKLITPTLRNSNGAVLCMNLVGNHVEPIINNEKIHKLTDVGGINSHFNTNMDAENVTTDFPTNERFLLRMPVSENVKDKKYELADLNDVKDLLYALHNGTKVTFSDVYYVNDSVSNEIMHAFVKELYNLHYLCTYKTDSRGIVTVVMFQPYDKVVTVAKLGVNKNNFAQFYDMPNEENLKYLQIKHDINKLIRTQNTISELNYNSNHMFTHGTMFLRGTPYNKSALDSILEGAEQVYEIDLKSAHINALLSFTHVPQFCYFDEVEVYDGGDVKDYNMYAYQVTNAPIHLRFIIAQCDYAYGFYVKYLQSIATVNITHVLRPHKVNQIDMTPVRELFDKLKGDNENVKTARLAIIGELGKHVKDETFVQAYASDDDYNRCSTKTLMHTFKDSYITSTGYKIVTAEVRTRQLYGSNFTPLYRMILNITALNLLKIHSSLNAKYKLLGFHTDSVYSLTPIAAYNADKIKIKPKDISYLYNLTHYGKVCCNTEDFKPVRMEMKQITMQDEYNMKEAADIIVDSSNILVKSIYPGSGKSHIIKSICDYERTVILCPEHEINHDYIVEGFKHVYTLHAWFGISPTGDKIHSKMFEDFDRIVIDEAYKISIGMLTRIYKYAMQKTNVQFIVLGDPRQLKPVGLEIDLPYEEYYNKIMARICESCLCLKIVKRCNEGVKELCDYIFEHKNDPELKSYLKSKFSNPIAAEAINICYYHSTIDRLVGEPVGKHIFDHKCKKFTIVGKKEGRFVLNTGAEICAKTLRTMYKFDKYRTGHSVQGKSFDGPIIIHDIDSHYVTWDWLYVALTRVRDLNSVYIV